MHVQLKLIAVWYLAINDSIFNNFSLYVQVSMRKVLVFCFFSQHILNRNEYDKVNKLQNLKRWFEKLTLCSCVYGICIPILLSLLAWNIPQEKYLRLTSSQVSTPE